MGRKGPKWDDETLLTPGATFWEQASSLVAMIDDAGGSEMGDAKKSKDSCVRVAYVLLLDCLFRRADPWHNKSRHAKLWRIVPLERATHRPRGLCERFGYQQDLGRVSSRFAAGWQACSADTLLRRRPWWDERAVKSPTSIQISN